VSIFHLKSEIFSILPEGTVKDEGTFLMLIILLGGFIGVAIYLRLRKRGEEKVL